MAEEMKRYTQNRELSWLAFNDRVLDEAMDPTVPLMERLKFLSIFTSNLDEFFMIRVGSLCDMVSLGNNARESRTGMTAAEQLERIYEAVRPLYQKGDRIYRALEKELRTYGICSLRPDELTQGERKYIKRYFREQIMPMLSPQIVDRTHPFPHLKNKEIYVIGNVTRKKETMMGIVPVSSLLPEIVYLPGNDLRFIRTENIILEYLDLVFERYSVTDKNCMCVTRNADITLDDELFDAEEDFRCHMKKLLRKRRKMSVVRLETAFPLEKRLEETVLQRCSLSKRQIYQTAVPMKMEYVFDLLNKMPSSLACTLQYPTFVPQIAIHNYRGNMLKLVSKQDMLFSFPYESMEPFLQLIREASANPDVLTIKITIYRLARNARLVEYLCAAAENGKEVMVLIELRARFDEQNNIDWSERLETAGCRVIYGFDAYKVHSKVCLITMRGKNGLQYITQIGTGNYNEKTAGQYTDVSLITADPNIGADAAEFFKNMSIGNLDGQYHHLLVSPANLKKLLLGKIEKEKQKGDRGHIVIKCNSVTDCDLIQALSRASQAGVKVELIVRGICCILPGIRGYTENISVTSIVGRFLEHARIYAFGDGDARSVYIGSADMMTRNTERRVEVIAPIYDKSLKKEIGHYLTVQLHDTVKARELLPDGTYRRKTQISCAPISAQDAFMEESIAHAAGIPERQKLRVSKLLHYLARKNF